MMISPRIPGTVNCNRDGRMRTIRRSRQAFTLVEVALALGIAAFALVPIFGLLPLGLQTSRSAVDLTISAQIAQRLTGMVQQANSSSDATSQEALYSDLQKSYYYFDGEGQFIPPGSTTANSSVYTAAILNPTGATGSLVDGARVVTLKLVIVNDPGHRLQGTPSALPTDLQPRSVTIPIYLANNGG